MPDLKEGKIHHTIQVILFMDISMKLYSSSNGFLFRFAYFYCSMCNVSFEGVHSFDICVNLLGAIFQQQKMPILKCDYCNARYMSMTVWHWWVSRISNNYSCLLFRSSSAHVVLPHNWNGQGRGLVAVP